MKLTILISLASSIAAVATPDIPEWHPPARGELRSPCPGINVLANHGILPRDGRNMNKSLMVDVLQKWYNITEPVTLSLFNQALHETGRPNATTFDMVDIRLHHTPAVDAIEGDGSFSRADFYWGDNYSLNQTIWKQTRSYWKGDTLDVQKFGNAARARYLTSKATNPWFFMDVTKAGTAMSFMANVLGDAEAGTVPTAYVDEWIVLERLPTRWGWSTSKKPTTLESIVKLQAKIYAASGLSGSR
ncbi:sterigmatocystin biosynthesis peroxidase stcC 8 [Paraphaeosphaeria minitans]|uniref:Sterigmatocystin biosynthesis peroxidase stcC 8 n=1 Tax=Paraphaeosphaeria minitans TaxID=565426 RepID=A0A9P6GP92_9PLEO|nr:sterigmatocystin biosynthesis peroxidase stcC 8 [Paraphaeosphaeria minitans]